MVDLESPVVVFTSGRRINLFCNVFIDFEIFMGLSRSDPKNL